MPTRAARRAQQRELAEQDEEQRQPSDEDQRRRLPWPRILAFGLIVVVILGAGTYMAASVFLGQRGSSTEAGYLPVRLSMAGFDPKVIQAKAGEPVKLDFWNTDNAMHLDGGGVHTFIMDSQKIYVKIPAEARQQYEFTAPATPGDYDFYCNTCCGGKASPTMHGTLHVSA
ncbi:MAG: cupredoxin domain-containing protein [Chloroflexi bacterium]|nr:cupredoxin domain-containing protein [Chloroflexota bacterium]